MSARGAEGQPSDQPPVGFDLMDWLRHRQDQVEHRLIEIGHGASPVAINQRFGGSRSYIGIESWDDPDFAQGAEKRIRKLCNWRQRREHLAFITSTTGHDPRDRFYDPHIDLSSAQADEMFLGNVLGSRLVGLHEGRIVNLMLEVRRLLKPMGHVVVREAISPNAAQVVSLAPSAGLQVEAEVNFDSSDRRPWNTLELFYTPHPTLNYAGPTTPDNDSYYLILSKLASTD